jgi:glycosyltransferase involved in cell wall biosynthesis
MSARVAVLVSTYNGEAFLRQQMQSLLDQTGVEIEVFARDDGSSDETRSRLAEFTGRWPRLADVPAGPNLGPAQSFLCLLTAAPGDFDAYAFCDQDDVWAPDKLARAVRLLAVGGDRPALYCSQVDLVDADLKPLGPGPARRDVRFEHLLFENIAFGATVVMNRAAVALIRARPPKSGAAMHDWWCALVVSALGEIVYDPEARLKYRQHGANTVGQAKGRVGELLRLWRIFWRDPARFWPVHAQATELQRLFGDQLPAERRAFLDRFVASKGSPSHRLRYALAGPIRRERLSGALVARLMIGLGLY